MLNSTIRPALVAIVLVAAGGSPHAAPDAAAELDARTLVERANAVLRGTSSHADLRMTVEGPSLHREYEMEGWNRGATEAKVVIHSPTQEMGVTTLRAGNDLRLYLPNVEQVVRVPPSMMHSAWMGSDFNYEDIVKADLIVSAYEHKIVSREERDGQVLYKIESLPKPDAPVVWGKVVLEIRKEPDGTVLLVHENDYSERGELVRAIELSEVDLMDGRRVPTRLVCKPQANPDRRTEIKYARIDFDVTLEDDFFSVNRLRLH
jgi:hypothetical protein